MVGSLHVGFNGRISYGRALSIATPSWSENTVSMANDRDAPGFVEGNPSRQGFKLETRYYTRKLYDNVPMFYEIPKCFETHLYGCQMKIRSA